MLFLIISVQPPFDNQPYASISLRGRTSLRVAFDTIARYFSNIFQNGEPATGWARGAV